jgi:hypothetical protein
MSPHLSTERHFRGKITNDGRHHWNEFIATKRQISDWKHTNHEKSVEFSDPSNIQHTSGATNIREKWCSQIITC